jgi:SNF2 family DNA or RNA helicase
MISNGPARTFTREAVAAWLFRLSECDWEKFIEKSDLKKGRLFYREGALTSLDVEANQIIVTQKVNREETYSVVEWNNQKPEIRTSSLDDRMGIALATAGLYEIEELVAEIHEEDPLLEDTPEENDQGGLNEDPDQGLNEEEQSENVTKQNSIVPLCIVLDISNNKGLSATPYWQISKDQKDRAYGSNTINNLENTDRPSLMSFVAEAGRQSFVFEKSKGRFRLKEWIKIATFSEEILPRWENLFCIEFLGDARLLKHGQRKLNWEIEARSQRDGSMTLRENFHLGKYRLGKENSQKIAKSRNGTTFITGHGLVRLDQEQLKDYDWWQRNRGDSKRTNWPRYMLFSLFARKYLNTRPDGKLADWKKNISQSTKELPKSKFSFLRPYQKEGISRLSSLHKLGCHGLLADEMGLGKTVQTLALISSNTKQDLPDLVICPASVVPVWIREAKERFPKIKVMVLNKETQFSDNLDPCLWVASYTQLRRHRHLLDDNQFRYAILDEAQLIKNPKAKVTQACLAIQAEHRLALSGTPIENTAIDLWTIFRFLMPGLLGGRKEFENDLSADPDSTAILLRKQVTPFVLRRMKSEVAKELPPKIENEIGCVLNEEQRKEYKKLVDGAVEKHGNDLKGAMKNAPTHVFSLLTRLRQTCCDVSLLPWKEGLESGGIKVDVLIEKLTDLHSSGHKVIVFSQFTSFLSILKSEISKNIPQLKILELTGSTRDRTIPVENFENSKGSAVILASLKAAGLGVTLKSADYVFLMDPWWNPAVEEQAIDRAHRLGRTKPTFIYRLVAKGTVEERVRMLQRSKKETFQKIIGDMDRPTALADHFSSLESLIDLNEN